MKSSHRLCCWAALLSLTMGFCAWAAEPEIQDNKEGVETKDTKEAKDSKDANPTTVSDASALPATTTDRIASAPKSEFVAPIESASPDAKYKETRKIMADDIIQIRVMGEPDLSGQFRVALDGSVTYPFLNVIRVKDKTPAEIEVIIRDGLMDGYLVKPEVLVGIDKYNEQIVTVSGAVNRPGPIPLPSSRRIDAYEALLIAGDISRLASENKIEIHRNGVTKRYTYKQLRDYSTDPSKRVTLEADDVIYVKERIL